MKRIGIVILALIAAGIITNCTTSGASAPPVDLAAPIIGKMAATPPDANGTTKVTGTEGAVEPGSIVMAGINDAGTTTGLLWNMTDAIVSTAHAQEAAGTFPSICTEDGRGCVLAGDDGSITELALSGVVIGTGIYVVIIDADGNERSPRSSLDIPASSFGMDGCAEASTMGRMVDIKNWDGVPLVLFEGDHLSGANNRLQIGNGVDQVELYLPGCYARQLVTYPLDAETILIAMISTDDQIVWASILNVNGFIGVIGWLMDDIPVTGAFGADPSYLLLAMDNGTSYSVEKFGLGDGISYASLAIPDPSNGDTLTGIMTMDTLGPFNDGGFLGAVMTTGVDGSSNPQTYYTLFSADTLANLSNSGETIRIGYEGVGGGVVMFDNARDVSDVKLGFDASISSLPAFLVVANRGSSMLHVIWLMYNAGSNSLYMTEDLAPRDQDIIYSYNESLDRKIPGSTITFRTMALGTYSGRSMVYVLTDELDLWTIDDYPSSSFFESFNPITGAVDPIAITIDDYFETVLIGDATAGVLDASSLWGGGM